MFVKVRDKKLYEEVVSQIQNLIETKQLKPGDILPSEEKLSKNIGVSRATVREGLRILGLMGLVETRRGKGTIVTENVQDFFAKRIEMIVQENGPDSLYVHEIDQILEPGIAKLAAEKADAGDIQKLQDVLQSMEDALQRGESGEAESLQFHQCLVSIVRNPLLMAVFELTKGIHEKGRALMAAVPKRPQQVLKEHSRIFAAIQKGDANLARRYMEEHMRKVGQTYQGAMWLLNKEK